MGRIRTFKPDLFVHIELQELEKHHPAQRPMLVFLGLFTVADKCGRFAWSAPHLKLSILPFVDYSMEEALALLESSGFIRSYTVEGKAYGFIPTWSSHQRISGKEAMAPPRYPDPALGEAPVKHPGSTREAPKPEKPKSPPKKTPEESLKLPPELEVWFEAIRFEVWPQDRLHQVAVARERFGLHARKFGAVTVYLACRSYLKSHDKVQEGYVQELYTFLGPKKATVLDYLEIAIPYLKDHPSLAALTIPPESEEAFRALIAQDEAAHV